MLSFLFATFIVSSLSPPFFSIYAFRPTSSLSSIFSTSLSTSHKPTQITGPAPSHHTYNLYNASFPNVSPQSFLSSRLISHVFPPSHTSRVLVAVMLRFPLSKYERADVDAWALVFMLLPVVNLYILTPCASFSRDAPHPYSLGEGVCVVAICNSTRFRQQAEHFLENVITATSVRRASCFSVPSSPLSDKNTTRGRRVSPPNSGVEVPLPSIANVPLE